MKSSTTSFILIFVLCTSACVHSLNPLYTEADLTTDSRLVGTWIDASTGESWTLSNGAKLKYSLVHVDTDGRKGDYDARLVRVGDALFLDIVPVKSGFAQNDSYREHFIATHTFFHVVIKESAIQISYVEPRWLKDFLAANPDAIRHEKVSGEIVLSSSPKETQKFLLGHLATRGAFSQPAELMRKRGGL